MKTYYQPVIKNDIGKSEKHFGLPFGLFSFEAFLSREEARSWLQEHGYYPDTFEIIEYHDDDIENVSIIDAHGNNLD